MKPLMLCDVRDDIAHELERALRHVYAVTRVSDAREVANDGVAIAELAKLPATGVRVALLEASQEVSIAEVDGVLVWPSAHAQLAVQLAERAALQRTQIAEQTATLALRSEFAHLLVHDLRNPLSAVLGNIELGLEDLSEAPASLADCRQLTKKALDMVASLCDVEQMAAGQLDPLFAPIDVSALVEGALDIARPTLRARGLRLDCDVESATVIGDANMLTRVMENLFDNAVRFAAHRGVVVVRGRRSAGHYEFAVGNDGAPIEAAEIPRMFQRYYRNEAKRPAARPNRGLGLYFCRLATEAHGGTLRVEVSEGLSWFRVALPFA